MHIYLNYLLNYLLTYPLTYLSRKVGESKSNHVSTFILCFAFRVNFFWVHSKWHMIFSVKSKKYAYILYTS
jgi:hypothetical protein